MCVSGYAATIHCSMTANMHLIDERYFLYFFIVCSVTGPLCFNELNFIPNLIKSESINWLIEANLVMKQSVHFFDVYIINRLLEINLA